MAWTMQQIVDLARLPLKDAAKARWSDATLLGYGNAGLVLLRRHRPELFIGALAAPLSPLALGNNMPIPDEYAQTLADYVGGRAKLQDDDPASLAKAAALLGLSKEA